MCGVEAQAIRRRAKALCQTFLEAKGPITNLRARKEKNKAELRDLRLEKKTWHATRDGMESRLKMRDDQVRDLTAHTKTLEASVASANDDKLKLSEELGRATLEKSELSARVAQLTRELGHAISEKSELVAQLSKEREDLASVQQKLADSEEKNNELQLEVLFLRPEVERFRDLYQDQASLISELEASVQIAEETTSEEKSRYESIIRGLNERIAALEAEDDEDEDDDEDEEEGGAS